MVEEDARKERKGASGNNPEEIGATSGRTHAQVLDDTLPPDEAREAKMAHRKATGG